MSESKIIFLIKCADSKGIIAKVTTFFYGEGFNILSCQQFTDIIQDSYFMRVGLDGTDLKYERKELSDRFSPLAEQLKLDWQVHYTEDKKKVAILVSSTSHCLYDLLEKHSEGKLNCSIPLVLGNRDKVKYVADQFNIEFHHFPTTAENWPAQQNSMTELLDEFKIDTLVLARFMRILSPEFVRKYPNKIINIHHAFLPAFQGANAYKRAYERG